MILGSRRPVRQFAVIFGLLMVGLLAFQGLSLLESGPGFPLDDAWIHQTYARNLAQSGAWEFRPGAPSGGSTAPLWTAVISIGHLLGLAPTLWSALVGLLLLGVTAWLAGRWFVERNPQLRRWQPIVFLVVILEWHLLWSAFSGMETIAQATLFLVAFVLLGRKTPNYFALGILTGVGIWLRPDVLTLFLPVGLSLILTSQNSLRTFFQAGIYFVVGTAMIAVPYLLFNLRVAGALWPNTFFAKQAEYEIFRQMPFINRWLEQLNRLLASVLIVLAPGIIYATVKFHREGRWRKLLPILWAAAFLGLYAFRLPVTYQHGRYAMPILPVVLVLGLEGMLMWLDWNASGTLRRVLSRVWITTLLVVLVIFFFVGARAFARDVAIIQTEMVQTAGWLQANTGSEDLIAAHDIGALGYFLDRDLLDLAGLVSPEVIPIIRDEAALAAYLNQQQADYLVTFPSWYPSLVGATRLIYSTEAPFSPAAGGENMAVYLWGFAP